MILLAVITVRVHALRTTTIVVVVVLLLCKLAVACRNVPHQNTRHANLIIITIFEKGR